MLDDFGDAADACGDDGNFASHCLKSRKAEGFELRRKQKKIGGGELFVDGVLLAEKEDVFLETKFADEVFGSTAIRAVPDKDEFRGHFGAHNGENFNGVSDALDGTKIREVHEDGFAVGGPLGGKTFVSGAVVEIAVHEIGNDFDGALDFEFLDSLVEQIARDGGDAVALLEDRKSTRLNSSHLVISYAVFCL